MQKLRHIDAIRGLAIIGVVFIHSGMAGPGVAGLPVYFRKLVDAGQYGVTLFYVASAYTLFLSISQRVNSGGFSKTGFYLRRFFRIAPLYYLAIIYYSFERFTGFRYLVGGEPIRTIPQDALFSNIFFVHGLSPSWINGYVPGGWSITVEMTFYLFVPLLFKLLDTINKTAMFLILTLAISASIQYSLEGNAAVDRESFLYCFFPNQLAVFVMGIIAFHYITGERLEAWLMMAAMICLSGYVIFIPNASHIPFAIAGVMVLVFLSKYPANFLVNRLTIFLGKVSFSMYITHFAVIFWLTKYGVLKFEPGSEQGALVACLFVRFALTLACSVVVSYVLYRFIEYPFQRLGVRFTRFLQKE